MRAILRPSLSFAVSVWLCGCDVRREYVGVASTTHDTIRVRIAVNRALGQVVELQPTTLIVPKLRVWGTGASLRSAEATSRCDIFDDENWSCAFGEGPLPGILIGAGIESMWMKDGVLQMYSGTFVKFHFHLRLGDWPAPPERSVAPQR